MSGAGGDHPQSDPREASRRERVERAREDAVGEGTLFLEDEPAEETARTPADIPSSGTPSPAAPTPPSPVSRARAGEPGGLRAEAKDAAMASREPERISRLGKGGFGEVWRVRYLNQEEAWKYLPKRAGTSLQAFREAFNARGVDHPNVVRVLDVHEEADHFILRMELIRGRNLSKVVHEDGALSPETACRYVLQVTGALEAAHNADPPVFHLDLKPSNLILKEDGVSVLVTDFGISATLNRASGLLDDGGLSAAGTPNFIAPEQVRLRLDPGATDVAIGPGVDVWALGVTLYYLLSLRYPFDFKTRGPQCILEDDPQPLTEFRPYISERLWAVIRKMLARDLDQRYKTMADVRSALIAYLDKVTCPSCKKSYPIADVQGVCPEASCPEPFRIGTLKESQALMRSAANAYSLSEHGAAIDLYRQVIEIEEAAGVSYFSEKAKRLTKTAESERGELEKRHAAILDHEKRGDLLGEIRAIDDARRLFSASRPLCELRRRCLETIMERCTRFTSEARRLVKQAKFAEADDLLALVAGLRDYPAVYRRLEEWAVAHGKDVPEVGNLFTSVAEQRAYHDHWRRELSDRLSKLELDDAIEALRRLQRQFPEAEDYESRIIRYIELRESLDVLRDPALEGALREVVEGAVPSRQRLELARLEATCDRILSAFDADEVPALVEVREIRARVTGAMDQVAKRRERLEERLAAARAEKLYTQEMELLRELVALAEATDIVPPQESAQARDRLRALHSTVERGRRFYEEGLRHLERNDFVQAHDAFKAAAAAAEGLFPEIEERLAFCSDEIRQGQELDDRIRESYDRLMSSAPDAEEFRRYFELARKVEERGEPDSCAEVEEKTISVVTVLLAWRSDQIDGAGDAAQRLHLLRDTVSLLLAIPPRVFGRAFRDEAAKLSARTSELASRLLAPLERFTQSSGEVAGRIQHLRDVVAELSRIRRAGPDGGGIHIASAVLDRVAESLVSCRATALRSRDPKERLREIQSALKQLVDLSDRPKVRARLVRRERAMRRTIQWVALARAGQVLFKVGLWASIPLAAGLVVYVVASQMHTRQQEMDRVQFVKDVTGALFPHAGEVALSPEWAESIGEGDTEGVEQYFRPLRLEGMPAPQAGAVELASWIGLERTRRQVAVELETRLARSSGQGSEIARAVREAIRAHVTRRLGEVFARLPVVFATREPGSLNGELERVLEEGGRLEQAFFAGDASQELELPRALDAYRRWYGSALEALRRGRPPAADVPPDLEWIGGEDLKLLPVHTRLAELVQGCVRRHRGLYAWTASDSFDDARTGREFESELYAFLARLEPLASLIEKAGRDFELGDSDRLDAAGARVAELVLRAVKSAVSPPR